MTNLVFVIWLSFSFCLSNQHFPDERAIYIKKLNNQYNWIFLPTSFPAESLSKRYLGWTFPCQGPTNISSCRLTVEKIFVLKLFPADVLPVGKMSGWKICHSIQTWPANILPKIVPMSGHWDILFLPTSISAESVENMFVSNLSVSTFSSCPRPNSRKNFRVQNLSRCFYWTSRRSIFSPYVLPCRVTVEEIFL